MHGVRTEADKEREYSYIMLGKTSKKIVRNIE